VPPFQALHLKIQVRKTGIAGSVHHATAPLTVTSFLTADCSRRVHAVRDAIPPLKGCFYPVAVPTPGCQDDAGGALQFFGEAGSLENDGDPSAKHSAVGERETRTDDQ
jgi:hypothetical protein